MAEWNMESHLLFFSNLFEILPLWSFFFFFIIRAKEVGHCRVKWVDPYPTRFLRVRKTKPTTNPLF